MMWDTTDRPNLLACALKLEAESFNVQITTMQFRGTNYHTVCAGGEVEEHLLQMVSDNEDAGLSIDPDELLANAQRLSANSEEVHQRQMLASVKRVCDLIQHGCVRSIVGQMCSGDPFMMGKLIPQIIATAQINAITPLLAKQYRQSEKE